MPRSPDHQSRVYDAISRLIQDGEIRNGAQLPSMRELAARFGVSVYPVKRALDILAAEGMVRHEHGRGVFVTDRHRPVQMSDSVVICIPVQDHLWSTLCMDLVYQLGHMRVVPHVLDVRMRHMGEMLRQFALSDTRYFVIMGTTGFPFRELLEPYFREKEVIGVMRWESKLEPANFHRVLSDSRGAGREVAQHLRAAGHEHAMFVGTPTAVDRLRSRGTDVVGHAERCFADEWERLGGRLTMSTFRSTFGHNFELDREDFLQAFQQESRPTAIFAQFDVGAWLAQRMILTELPELDGQVEIIGYGDTPWSHAAVRTISSVNLRLPLVAERCTELIRQLRGHEAPNGADLTVPARLILRETSQLRPVPTTTA